MTSPRALIILSTSLFLLALVGAGPAFSEAQEKEGAIETPAPRSQHPPPASDSQPAPHKPAPESKPPSQASPPAKADSSTEHKEGAPEKSAPSKPGSESKPSPQASPPAKVDSSTDHKEGVPEKSAPSKPASESKPPPQASPPAKADSSADHKEGAPEKPAPSKPASESKPPSQAGPPAKVDSSTEHKEGVPEKSAPSKPGSESKPTSQASPPAKADSSADHKHKDGLSEKPVPQKPAGEPKPHPTPQKPSAESKPPSQSSPSTKADSPSAEPEGKEKEPVVRKSLGSLILSVKLALMGDPRLFHYEIEVGDDQQTVTLTGRVSTEEEKAAATEIAQSVQGVKTVVNNLAVEKDLAKTLLRKQDEIVTGLIKERFSKSATLKAANFEVKTEDGVVQLNGSVRFQVIALEAAEAARQVPGVRAVNTEKIRLEGES